MPEIVQQHLQAGQRYLVVELVSGKAMLSNGQEIFRRPGGPGWMQFACVDLQPVYERFQREAPPRETFTLTEVASMALTQSPTVNAWIKAGALVPSVRDRDGTRGKAMLFDRTDAFVACLLASLKRKCGIPLGKLKNVSKALRTPPSVSRPQKSRRPARKRKKARAR